MVLQCRDKFIFLSDSIVVLSVVPYYCRYVDAAVSLCMSKNKGHLLSKWFVLTCFELLTLMVH